MNDPKGYYEILGVKNDAAQDDIKKSYRKLARQYHPDTNDGCKDAEEKFKKLTEAYEVLSDSEKKRKYDMGLLNDYRTSNPYNTYSSIFGDLNSFFNINIDSSGQGMGWGWRRQVLPKDINMRLRITLKDVMSSKTVILNIKRNIACSNCKGTNYIRTNNKCSKCNGTGYVGANNAFMVFTCSVCGGSGNTTLKCNKCSNGIEKVENEKIEFKIPNNIKPMTSFILKGKGHDIYEGNNRVLGDVNIVFDFPDKYEGVYVDGFGNLYVSVHVPFDIVMREDVISVNILDCKSLEVKIDSTKPSGYSYSVAGHGLTQGSSAFVKVFIDLPKKKISEEERSKLIKTLEDVYGRSDTKFIPSTFD